MDAILTDLWWWLLAGGPEEARGRLEPGEEDGLLVFPTSDDGAVESAEEDDEGTLFRRFLDDNDEDGEDGLLLKCSVQYASLLIRVVPVASLVPYGRDCGGGARVCLPLYLLLLLGPKRDGSGSRVTPTVKVSLLFCGDKCCFEPDSEFKDLCDGDADK